jgi:GNAT superfamily N-acetyltransferase
VSVLVRAAEAGDAPRIARVHVDSWRGAYRGLLPDSVLDGLSVSGREDQWRRRLAPGASAPATLVAVTGGRIDGFVTYMVPSRDPDEADDVGEIPALYVQPQAWGGGLGVALITTAAARMAEAGCRTGILWMLAGNDRAAGFYERQGWSDDSGRRPSQYFPDMGELVEVRFRRAL